MSIEGVEGQPLSIDELRGILRRENTQRHTSYLLGSISIVAIIAFAVVAFVLLGAVGKVSAVSERNDCARAYASILTRTDRQLAIEGWTQADRLGIALYGSVVGNRPTQQQKDQFGKGSVELHKAVQAVRALPTVDDAVDHGFTLNGKKYPPCPTV